MGTGWSLKRKSVRRPKKSGGTKRHRENVQKNRLVSLGVSEEQANKLTPQQVRTILRRPKLVKKGQIPSPKKVKQD